jgi:hypothetical protein
VPPCSRNAPVLRYLLHVDQWVNDDRLRPLKQTQIRSQPEKCIALHRPVSQCPWIGSACTIGEEAMRDTYSFNLMLLVCLMKLRLHGSFVKTCFRSAAKITQNGQNASMVDEFEALLMN